MRAFDSPDIAERIFTRRDAFFPLSRRSIPARTLWEQIVCGLSASWANGILPKRLRTRTRPRRDPADGPTAGEYETMQRDWRFPRFRPAVVYTPVAPPPPPPPPQMNTPAHSPYPWFPPPSTPFQAAPLLQALYPQPEHPPQTPYHLVPSREVPASFPALNIPLMPLVRLFPLHRQGSIHPFLDGRLAAQYPLRFNLGSRHFRPKWIRPGGNLIPIPSEMLDVPATIPMVEKLRIGAEFVNCDFTVKVQDESECLTLKHVLVQIQTFFRGVVSQKEVDSLNEEDRAMVRRARERRCARNPQMPLMMMKYEPVRWVDYIGGVVWFKGLVPDEKRRVFIVQVSR